jgi:hypothetical protein
MGLIIPAGITSGCFMAATTRPIERGIQFTGAPPYFGQFIRLAFIPKSPGCNDEGQGQQQNRHHAVPRVPHVHATNHRRKDEVVD